MTSRNYGILKPLSSGLVFCRYDYSGYGQSSGKVSSNISLELFITSYWNISINNRWTYICNSNWQPSEGNTYADIEAAYRCLEENYGTHAKNIILYGQSVGSGPTLHLASQLPQFRAVVLHSPILSGVRVVYPTKHTYWFDIYKVSVVTYPAMNFSFPYLLLVPEQDYAFSAEYW